MVMCYNNQTFCSSDCKRDTCFRFWTDELQEAARKWWHFDPDNAPIAFADFSPTCEDYLP